MPKDRSWLCFCKKKWAEPPQPGGTAPQPMAEPPQLEQPPNVPDVIFNGRRPLKAKDCAV